MQLCKVSWRCYLMIICTAYLTNIRAQPKQKRKTGRPTKTSPTAEKSECMSTYSFHVPEGNGMKCSPPPAEGAKQGASEHVITKRLLVAVQKLVTHNHRLDQVRSAEQVINNLTQTVMNQHNEMMQLSEKLVHMQTQLSLMTSGRKDEAADDQLFTGFSGVTNQYLGCPFHHKRRIHEIAPVTHTFKQVVRLIARSCYEYQRSGYRVTGSYLIDPDGVDGLAPFSVICDMSEVPAVARIHHNQENRTHVKGYEGAGSYLADIIYPGIDRASIELLLESSYKCEQFLTWECRGAVINKKSWYEGRGGRKATAWAGGENTGCACHLTDTCKGGNLCNCDINDDGRWLQDGGNITDKRYLPVSKIYIGDTGGHNEEGYHTLGPLKCYSDLTNPTGSSNAFIPVTVKPPFDVFCDYDGWLVIQRRTTNSQSVSFNRTWTEYRTGFGDLTADHWLGLEKIHQLTNQNVSYNLLISIDTGNSLKLFAHYAHFKLANEDAGYKLKVGQYNGTAPDWLTQLQDASFTTNDKDNDANPYGNCASELSGGWWFTQCNHAHHGNPNSQPVTWHGLNTIESIEMKIKPGN